MRAGPRDQPVTFQRDTGTTKDAHGGKTASWTTYVQAFAQVVFGSGSERREAAQEASSQPATFRVPANPLTRALTVKDRIGGYLGSNWDIVSVSLLGRDGVEVTAVRAG